MYIIWMMVMVVVFSGVNVDLSFAAEQCIPSRWSDPSTQPPDPEEYFKDRPGLSRPYRLPTVMDKQAEPAMATGQGGGSGLVLIVIDEKLDTSSLTPGIDRLKTDLEGAGYTVKKLYSPSIRTATPSQIRAAAVTLKNAIKGYQSQGLVGCILIGVIPNGYFLIPNEKKPSFPCEIYLMDLDGTWVDGNGDGTFDGHEGSTAAEIFIGRLDASTLTAIPGKSEIALLQGYLTKNHSYRQGNLHLTSRALGYLDDDWSNPGVFSSPRLDYLYKDVKVVTDKNTTTRDNYISELGKGYEWLHLTAHSTVTDHSFTKNGMATIEDKITSSPTAPAFVPRIYDVNNGEEPKANFCTLNACSAGSWIANNYIDGYYIFDTTYGLTVLGGTREGGMQYTGDFYRYLSDNKTIGTALKDWFEAHRYSPSFNNYDKPLQNHYGVVVLGDPTLKVKSQVTNDTPIVWLGDLDNNGRVEAADILPIGICWGKKGPARAKAERGTEWRGCQAKSWGYMVGSCDPTYADANGDGVIDTHDSWSIRLNHQRTHIVERRPSSAPTAEAILATIDHSKYLDNYKALKKALEENISDNSEIKAEMIALIDKVISMSSGEAGVSPIQVTLEQNSLLSPNSLGQNYPNPMNPETWIPFSLADDSDVSVRIYNLSGSLVRTLDLGQRPAGDYSDKLMAAYWDGKDENGNEAASGTYLYQLQAGPAAQTRKMIVLK